MATEEGHHTEEQSKKTTQVYVGHVNRRVTESDLRHEFEKFGKVLDLVPKNGFAFVVLSPPHLSPTKTPPTLKPLLRK